MQSKGLTRVFSNITVQKHHFFPRLAFFIVQLSHPYRTTGKTIALTRQIFVDKVISLLFNMLSTLVITFLPRSKCLLISWLQSPSAVTLEPRKIKSAIVSTVSPPICHEVERLLLNEKILTPWKESYDQPRQHIIKQRHYFVNKVWLVKAMVFPVVMYGCESWTIKKPEC